MDVTNRVALITGGKRLGGEIALALATRGADIALCYRASRAEAQTTADAVLRLGRRVHLVQGDLSKPDDCRRAVSETADRLGRLDILANLASLYAEKPFDELTDEDWDSTTCRGSARRVPLLEGCRAAHARPRQVGGSSTSPTGSPRVIGLVTRASCPTTWRRAE